MKTRLRKVAALSNEQIIRFKACYDGIKTFFEGQGFKVGDYSDFDSGYKGFLVTINNKKVYVTEHGDFFTYEDDSYQQKSGYLEVAVGFNSKKIQLDKNLLQSQGKEPALNDAYSKVNNEISSLLG